jgi:hypothetical protein
MRLRRCSGRKARSPTRDQRILQKRGEAGEIVGVHCLEPQTIVRVDDDRSAGLLADDMAGEGQKAQLCGGWMEGKSGRGGGAVISKERIYAKTSRLVTRTERQYPTSKPSLRMLFDA